MSANVTVTGGDVRKVRTSYGMLPGQRERIRAWLAEVDPTIELPDDAINPDETEPLIEGDPPKTDPVPDE